MSGDVELLARREETPNYDLSEIFSKRSEDGGFEYFPKKGKVRNGAYVSDFLSGVESREGLRLAFTTGNEIYKNSANNESIVFVGKNFSESNENFEDAQWYILNNLVTKLSRRLERKTRQKQTPNATVSMKDMLGILDDVSIYSFDAVSANDGNRTVPSSLTIKGKNANRLAGTIGSSEKHFAFFNALRESNMHLYREMNEKEQEKYSGETIGYMQALGLMVGSFGCTSVKVGRYIMTDKSKIYTRK